MSLDHEKYARKAAVHSPLFLYTFARIQTIPYYVRSTPGHGGPERRYWKKVSNRLTRRYKSGISFNIYKKPSKYSAIPSSSLLPITRSASAFTSSIAFPIAPKKQDQSWGDSIYTDFKNFEEESLKMCVEIFDQKQANQLHPFHQSAAACNQYIRLQFS